MKSAVSVNIVLLTPAKFVRIKRLTRFITWGMVRLQMQWVSNMGRLNMVSHFSCIEQLLFPTGLER